MNERPLTPGQRLRQTQAAAAAARRDVVIDQIRESDPVAARELANQPAATTTAIPAAPVVNASVPPPVTPPPQVMITEYDALGNVTYQGPATPPPTSIPATTPPTAAVPTTSSSTAAANRAVDRVQTAQETLNAINSIPPGAADESQLAIQRLAAQRELSDANAALASTNHSVNAQPNATSPAPASPSNPADLTPQAPFAEEPALQSPDFGTGTQTNAPPVPTATPGAAASQSAQDPRPSPDPTAVSGPVREVAATTVTAAAPGSAQAGLTAAAPDIRFNFEPNEHNQYDRVTYKFKLSMVNDKDAGDVNVGDKIRNNSIRKIIVAESGVTTGFNITDVEIQDTVSPNFRSRGNMTTDIKFTLIEPYSLTLPDKMYSASMELGVPNWRLAPLFLELEFKYIKSDGSFYTPTQGNLVKIYQLVITEFDSQVTEVGSTYQIQAATQGNRGFADAFNILPHTYNVTAAGNVKDFFDKLGTAITELYTRARRENTRRTVTPIMVYKFVVTKDLGEQEIDFTQQSTTRRSRFSQASPGGEITVARGTSIAALVDDIMASLKNPRFFIPRDQQDGAVRIPRIECRTRNIGWDGLLNDYIREFTFVISTKESVRPVPFREYGVAYQSNPEYQKARLEWLAEYMKKSYDYYYTGLNTEVINVDIKFNQLHAIVQPLMDTIPWPQYANAARVEGFTQEYNQTLAARDQAQSERDAAVLAAVESGTTPQLLPQAQSELATQNNRLRELSQQSVILFDPNSTARTDIGLPAESSENATAFRTRIAQIEANNRRSIGRKQFLEDAPKRNPATLAADSLNLSYMTDPRDMANMQARAAGGGMQTPQGSNNPQDNTRAMVTSIATQIYDKTNQMLEVDMKIKGDPYWLGVSDVERMLELTEFLNEALNNNVTNEVAASRSNTAEWFNRDAVFLLKFRAGTPPNVSTGFQDLNNESDFFYGIYTAIEVKHEFKNGVFTQELKAMRDMLINVSTIRQAQSRASNPTQPPVASAGPSNNENAPTGAATPANNGDTTRSIQSNTGDPNAPGPSLGTSSGGEAARTSAVTNNGGLRDPAPASNETRTASLQPTDPRLIQNPEYAELYTRLHGEAFSRADGSSVSEAIRAQRPDLYQAERARANLINTNTARAGLGLGPVPRS